MLTVRTVGNRQGVAVIAQCLAVPTMRTVREYRNERRFSVCYRLVDGRCRLASLGFASATWNLSSGDQMSGWIACTVLVDAVNDYMHQGEPRSRASEHVYPAVHLMVVMRLNRQQRRCWKLPEGRRTASCKSNSRKELRSCVAQLDYPLRPTNAANGW